LHIFLDYHSSSNPRSKNQFPQFDKFSSHIELLIQFEVPEQTRIYCLFEASDDQSVLEYHFEIGIRCEWIEEVTSLNRTSDKRNREQTK
jgi:hypothetical protein